jgi:hypothetical protein
MSHSAAVSKAKVSAEISITVPRGVFTGLLSSITRYLPECLTMVTDFQNFVKSRFMQKKFKTSNLPGNRSQTIKNDILAITGKNGLKEWELYDFLT